MLISPETYFGVEILQKMCLGSSNKDQASSEGNSEWYCSVKWSPHISNVLFIKTFFEEKKKVSASSYAFALYTLI